MRLGYLADEQSAGMTMELYWKLKALANLSKKATSHGRRAVAQHRRAAMFNCEVAVSKVCKR